MNLINIILFKDFIYLFLERGEGDREKHCCVRETVASHMPLTRDLACNPGMCPNWESNQQPFSLQSSAQSTEPHQPGLINILLKYTSYSAKWNKDQKNHLSRLQYHIFYLYLINKLKFVIN